MLAKIAGEFPDFDPVARMIDLAERAYADIEQRTKACQAAEEGKTPEGDPTPVTAAELSSVQAMYERPARFLVPQLKATEISVDPQGGSFTVTINKPADA